MWRVWAFLGLFAMVLLYFTPEGVGANVSWLLDQGSKLAGIIALLVAWKAYQLADRQLGAAAEQLKYIRADQAKALEDQRRHPVLHIGFSSGEMVDGKLVAPLATEVEIRPDWGKGESNSFPVRMRVLVRNVGERTARDLTVNLVLEPFFSGLVTVDERKASCTVDDAGNVRVMYHTRFLHVGANFEARFSLVVPQGVQEVAIAAGAMATDTPRSLTGLIATVVR